MRKTWLGVCVVFMAGSALASAPDWNDEQREVIRFLESLPETYASGNFDAYMDKYHTGYTNWYMTHDKLHDHGQLGAMVQRSLDAGMQILDFRVTPLTIEIDGDEAFVRYIEEEKGLNDDKVEEWRRYHFVASLRRSDGKWQFWRTSFFEVKDDS